MSPLSSMELRRRDDAGLNHLHDGIPPSACIARSRRFSASNLTSYREEARSFRYSANISSTASSPGYTPKDLIDPATYSFTAALRALQARSGKGWDYLYSCRSLVPDGSALNSKWNEAEKYICNPLSGEVPMECLSAKTLSGRSFRASTQSTKSAPLVFSHARLVQMRPNLTFEEGELLSPTSEEEEAGVAIDRGKGMSRTRDVGIQSTLSERSWSSSNSSPGWTPPIKDSSITSCNSGGSPSVNDQKTKGAMTLQEKGEEDDEASKPEEREQKQDNDAELDNHARECGFRGCLSWTSCLKSKRKKTVHKLNQKDG
ncbi:hypothetical protein H6P81_009544 [Aristolochia fimbriata]|uniref:Uncharacterized protein n=1 Tax=Aristolochia fimbriata TaxID=158543 RepID=A0AAV7ELS9_ARIFI|nr:hypothetical protein H6P81_009544 [Aristolochia fimbriata]